jgi:hypothetical protein
MIVMNLTRKARTPSALHIIVTNLFPVNIQLLQSFQYFSHYLSRMCSRLTQNKDVLNGRGWKKHENNKTMQGVMKLDYLKPKSPFPLSRKMWSWANWRLHKYLLPIPTCRTWCFIWCHAWGWVLCAKKLKQKINRIQITKVNNRQARTCIDKGSWSIEGYKNNMIQLLTIASWHSAPR